MPRRHSASLTLRAAASLLLAAVSQTALAGEAEEADPFTQVGPSIAKINVANFYSYQHCTGVQAGRRAALTLDECLSPSGPEETHFLFAYDRQKWGAHRVGRATFPDPTHLQLALVCLDKVLPASRFGTGGSASPAGDRAIVAAYIAPKIHRLTFRSCKFGALVGKGELLLACPTRAGSAGAAVFALGQDGARLFGIVADATPKGSLVLGWTGDSPDALCPPNGN